MPLVRLKNISLHYGTQVLLDHVDLTIAKGDKIGLLGRNGVGKTTLLKIIAADLQAETGERWTSPGCGIAWLQQTLPEADDQSVYDVVASGLAETGRLLAQYHHLTQSGQDTDLQALERVQHKLEAVDGWQMAQRVETTISHLSLPAEALMSELSGGWRRRVALARALVSEPDVLLLDEPTNHLDLTAIQWLEEQLQTFSGALVLISHDRRFLQNVSTSMAELDRGTLTVWQGSYEGFLRHREQQLADEERANALFDKKLAQEETWIRQGIKARRTRNEGRVRTLKKLREERSARRERVGQAGFSIDTADRSGKLVAELDAVSKAFDGQRVISEFSTIIQRGDRIGIVGPNGSGKSTLVQLILGEVQPDSGTVTLGTRLEIAYSDQLRGLLDPEKSLMDNVCGGQEFVEIGGRRKHAISYLNDFLFSPDRARMPVKALSGGEQNRAVLAQLFSRPANLLVLDEPTNDLDIETLELLEEILLEFAGTVLLVSHDRAFMDNVVTSLIVLDGRGGISEHVGGYSDWQARTDSRRVVSGEKTAEGGRGKGKKSRTQQPAKPAKPRLSYKDQREKDQLPGIIEKLEARQQQLQATMAQPGFYESDHLVVEAALRELAALQEELDAAFDRWAELEGS